MTNSTTAVIPEIAIRDNRAVTTSVAVANYFEKAHDNVLKKIRAVVVDCDPSWRLVNFNETFYTRENPNGGEGIATPMFELTRDAFVLIVMGFTGKKALQWKIDYINAFNKMEEELISQHSSHFPLDADLFVQIKGGKTVYIQQAQPGECFMSVESAMETARCAGYVVIKWEELLNLRPAELLEACKTAKQLQQKWTKLVAS
ncbi:Rha family transcriptional regulator [Salmonella enterica]